MDVAAIILCAGKGTRMGDDSKNKVCFDCAGTPTIKRIIKNMKGAGVNRFVIVIGHQAYSVMDTLDGVDGVVYAYQKEQKGTGHAAMCGLNALKTVGYSGKVIISMGDKIIATSVLKEMIAKADGLSAVWGVQPISANYNGGRVVTVNDKPFGVVEFADAALLKLGEVDVSEYEKTLSDIKLNAKKAQKVISKALEKKPSSTINLCGVEFRADEVLNSKYANAGLYCFDVDRAIEIIKTLGSNNAQGEIYLTDALEKFATDNEATIYEVKDKKDMLTYSTKSELREISKCFMKKASTLIEEFSNDKFTSEFLNTYAFEIEEQKQRYIKVLSNFIEKYGDKNVIITRSPGRINLMGRHIDHRGGGINVMATDKDVVLVCSPREDDIVNLANVDETFSDKSFSISNLLGDEKYEKWLDYLGSEKAVKDLNENKGCWSNYVKSAVLRAQFNNETALCGMDIMAHGTIPIAAGLSSSSSIVVATMEAVVGLNCLNVSDKDFITLCGEGEWFVGSRGGAGDHAAMKCGEKGKVTHVSFKPFEVGEKATLSEDCAVIVANSMLKAKKSEGSKDTFNAKIACYEFAFMFIKRLFPEYNFLEFRDIAKVRPYSKIYQILKEIPESVTRGSILALLPERKTAIKKIFSNHVDPKYYDLRGVALYGISECVRADRCVKLLNKGDYAELGKLMKISHNGDRLNGNRVNDEELDELIKSNADIAYVSGTYSCSVDKIDYLCDLLNQIDGVLGSEIVGAGLGGCVIALVEKSRANEIISIINEKYYDKFNFERCAQVCNSSNGSFVIF